ncbi:Uncharacterised protein [Mycobacterium tuberculosis]|uniref:Uncharacterized protein n=1 Tax=Mycobacterium tuberculosis TaxID=1773 RepID=A0A655EBY8_MYCTX|nr:Uncharacterised protein [Mycobacterium tuberculosis]CNV29027.1 Uncharacterised protein [Mycobacterium tuberculosis]CNV37522.1 Uncharacterised protein [Mycobacterium tuberculosis]COX87048.1 Uncharacterised protein [Mycobacterium tuberculosis]
MAVGIQMVAQPDREVAHVEHPDVLGVQRVGLLLVEPGRAGVDVGNVERGHHLVETEQVVVVGYGPAEQREVVQQAFGDEPAVAVGKQVRLRIALRELLGALPQDRWEVREFRNPLSYPDPDQRLM